MKHAAALIALLTLWQSFFVGYIDTADLVGPVPRTTPNGSNRTRPARRGGRRDGSPGFNSQDGVGHTKQDFGEGAEYGPSTEEETRDDMPERAIQLLQRLNDRVTALHALDEQQLRRLETLEYRLTKLEVQMQEKSDGLKTELREVSRRVQQLDWQSSKMDTTLEAIKLDTSGLNQGQEHLRGMLSGPESRISTLAETELQGKLHMLTAALHGVRIGVVNMYDNILHINRNITKLTNMTSQIASLSNTLVTKQHFRTALLDLRQISTTPVQAISAAPASTGEEKLPVDCHGVQKSGYNQSGVYKIKPAQASQPFFVYCQLETRGGGWTVIQNRYEGTMDFYRDWEDYKQGFGNIAGEFWLGLEKIHILTNYKINELLIELQDFTLTTTHAYYSAFAVGTEVEGYPIRLLGSYDGDAGDSLVYHAGSKFSTYDIDHDAWKDGNCAESHTGAWWYNGCDTSNLNGRYLGGELQDNLEYQGMYWYDWHGPTYSLRKTRISVRPSTRPHDAVNNTLTPKPDKQKRQPHKTKVSPKEEVRRNGKQTNEHHDTGDVDHGLVEIEPITAEHHEYDDTE